MHPRIYPYACAFVCACIRACVQLTLSYRLWPQVGVVSAFAQTLRRYTSLNHLAQAARAVLQNTSQINQMLSDLNRVDFANVQVTFPSKVPHSQGQVSGTSLESRGNMPVPPTPLSSLLPSKKVHRPTSFRSQQTQHTFLLH